MRKQLSGVFTLVALAGLLFAGGLDPNAAKPPVAKKVPKITKIHGETLVDNYFWLREKTDPEVIAYLEAENAYTEAVMKPTKPLQETLYKEMLARIKQTDETVPYRKGDYWYYSRTIEGRQYSVHCRKKGLEGKEEVLLDLNELAKGHKFLGLGAYTVSDDSKLLAYSLDVSGFRDYTGYIKNLTTGEVLADRIPKVHGSYLVWAADNKTLFYSAEDDAKRPYRVFRHVLGGRKDELLFEEKDDLYNLYVQRSRDRSHLFMVSESSTTCEARVLRSEQPKGEFRLIMPRVEGHRYYPEHRAGSFFFRTNKDAKNFRIVTAPVDKPEQWKDVAPHDAKVKIEEFDLFENHCVISEWANGLPGFRVIDLAKNESHRMTFAEPAYFVSAGANAEFKTNTFRFDYESFVTPETVYDYDLTTRERKRLKTTEILGGYKSADYVVERIFATAPDGVRVPISLAYKKGTPKDGTAPLHLYGYGAYGYSLPDEFSIPRLGLLDRGVIFAIPHIRGGGELGELWYEDGKLFNKKNSFTDFIACADHLIEKKYTNRNRLVIEGRSAGGLLMGGVLTLKPDIAKAAVLGVPFVDAINTMLDTSLPLTTQEFLEWGNPAVKKDYDYMKSYCPYTNLKAQDYPAMLLTTSLNDSQVMYFEPAKYTAKLRSLKTDKNVLLLHTNMSGGHGGFSGRYDALKDRAFNYAFVLNQMGIEK